MALSPRTALGLRHGSWRFWQQCDIDYARAASTAAAAWSRMFGGTWEQVSRVMVLDECPSISETIFGFTLRVSSSVAHVCRRSWKRISGSPARFRSGLNFCFVTARLSSGSPVSDANIRPSASPGLHREPTLSISASWRFRWLLRASVALLVSFTLRLELVVFGAVNTGPLLVMVSVRRT